MAVRDPKRKRRFKQIVPQWKRPSLSSHRCSGRGLRHQPCLYLSSSFSCSWGSLAGAGDGKVMFARAHRFTFYEVLEPPTDQPFFSLSSELVLLVSTISQVNTARTLEQRFGSVLHPHALRVHAHTFNTYRPSHGTTEGAWNRHAHYTRMGSEVRPKRMFFVTNSCSLSPLVHTGPPAVVLTAPPHGVLQFSIDRQTVECYICSNETDV